MPQSFSEGVRAGGLRDQQEIQVLLCYLIDTVGGRLEERLLTECILANEIANHFETAAALEMQIKRGNITEENGVLTQSDAGREIARVLAGNLPLTIQERAVQSAVRLLAQHRNAASTKVEITPTDLGVRVTCAADTSDQPVMSFSLVVADNAQAELVRDRFLQDPVLLYRTMVEVLMNPDLKKTADMLYIPLRRNDNR